MTFRARLRAAWERLRGAELTPWHAAASAAVGIAIGVTPLWGAHFFLVLGVCVPLRLDARIAYLASNVSLPFVAPLITVGEIQLGALARTGSALPVDRAALHAHGTGAFALDLAIGTLLAMPLAAAIGGALAWALAATWPRRTELGAAIARVARRYPTRAARLRAHARLASDPIARALLELGHLGEVCDVACGAGELAILLHETGRATRVRGVDRDPARAEVARAASKGLPATFEQGDARRWEIAPCDTVLVIDVLHRLPPPEQDALLARAAAQARKRVVVREIDPGRGARGVLTRLAERLRARPALRFCEELSAVLRRGGLEVTVEPCDAGTPFANVLIVATR